MEDSRRCLIFDPFSGISGDMTLGALIDLGLGEDWLRGLVDALSLDVNVSVASVTRGSLKASSVNIDQSATQPARRLGDILEIIESADVDSTARGMATRAFQRLAEVEGAIHGVLPEEVHFHEVGATDAIVDIVAAAAGVVELGATLCFTRPIAIGRGWAKAEHGALPLPAPATLRLLEGLPVFESDLEGELTTPTGAALLAALTEGRTLSATYVPLRSGYGAGSRDLSTHPNCLRLVLAEIETRGGLCIVQADLDDMPPEYVPPLRDALASAGAIDVWSFPVQMKKGRTGVRVEALVPAVQRQSVAQALFQNSTTLGLRFWPVDRQVLPRVTNRIEWRGFTIRIKTGYSAEGHVICKPEYEDIVQAARALGLPPLKVRQEVERMCDSGS
jgi:uncharacterized protein (TIGR00299 family) protein